MVAWGRKENKKGSQEGKYIGSGKFVLVVLTNKRMLGVFVFSLFSISQHIPVSLEVCVTLKVF